MSDADKILKAMVKTGQPMRPGDIANLTGMDKKVVSKAMDTLKKEGKIQSPKRCFWAPA